MSRPSCGHCGASFDLDALKVVLRPSGDDLVICPGCRTEFPRDRQFSPADPAAVLDERGEQ